MESNANTNKEDNTKVPTAVVPRKSSMSTCNLTSKSRVRFDLVLDPESHPTTPDTDPIVSITINDPITPTTLKNILIDYSLVRFATFNAGIPSVTTLLDFHGHIILPNLKKLTIRIPNIDPISAQNPPIPNTFKRLFHFLKVVEYRELESLDIICSPDRGSCIPMASAIIPCYQFEDSNPLMDLIRMNRNTMKSISVGPALNKFYMKLHPVENLSAETGGIQQLEVFKGFPNYPMLASWSKMLRPQKHLSKLYIAFNDLDVWDDVTQAIRLSSESLNTVKFKAFGCQHGTLSLEVFKFCTHLTHLGIRFLGVKIVGWEFLPNCVKQITLAGPVTSAETKCIAGSLKLIEEIFIVLKPVYTPEVSNEALNILQHPSFELMKDAPPSLKEFSVEVTDLPLDMGPIRRWTELQTDFKLIEHLDSEFSLMRDVSEKAAVGVVSSPPSPAQAVQVVSDVQEEEESPMWYGTCISSLGWRSS